MSKKKISAKVRDEAATICAISASTLGGYAEAADAIGASNDAFALAYDAWMSVVGCRWPTGAFLVASDAEAEALLRTGWTP